MTNYIMPTLPITAYGETMEVTPSLGRYSNGRLAISFLCDEGPYGHLTLNLPDDHLGEGEVFIKDWSENEPMIAALLEAGWITLTGREVRSGFVFPKVAVPAGPLKEFIDQKLA